MTWPMMKTRQDNDVTDGTIGSMTKMKLNCRDRSNRVQSVTKIRQNNDETNLQVWSMLKPKLNYQDLSDWVKFRMKTIQDNDVTDRTSSIYAKNDNELS